MSFADLAVYVGWMRRQQGVAEPQEEREAERWRDRSAST